MMSAWLQNHDQRDFFDRYASPFTRDEWNQLLQVFNTMDVSLFCRCHLSHVRAGNSEEMKKERRPCVGSKSRPARNLVVLTPAESSPQHSSRSVLLELGAGRPDAFCSGANRLSSGRPDGLVRSA